MFDDICYIEVVGRKIIIHTLHGVHNGSLTDQLKFILLTMGYRELFDSKIVNMEKVLTYDAKEHKVYFDKDRKIYCKVSRPNIYKIRQYQKIFNSKPKKDEL